MRIRNIFIRSSRQFLAVVAGLAINPVWAQDCTNAMTTPEVNACASAEQEKVEAQLNHVYQLALKHLDKPDAYGEQYSAMKKSLVEAERAWVKYRDAECNARFDLYAGGTIRTVIYIGCMQTLTEQRIKELNEYIGHDNKH